MESTNVQELLNFLLTKENYINVIQKFKESSEVLLKLEELPNSSTTDLGRLILLILKIRKEICHKNYQIIEEITMDHLEEIKMECDFLTSILINYHFICSSRLNKLDRNLYFHLLTINKELTHSECVSVLTNICFKIGISLRKNIEIVYPVELNHQGLYYYYRGFMHLMNENYKDSYSLLKHSLVLRSSFKTHICLLVNSLLLNENFKLIKNKRFVPYIELMNSVKDGDIQRFKDVVKKFKSTFERDLLYGVILRLENNVKLQNFKKMSKVYSTIKVKDLIKRGIGKDMLNTKEEIIHFNKPLKLAHDINSRIEECKEVMNKMESLMKYNEVESVNYENTVME